MKLNEDNTVTLSLRETQRYVTKVINPEFKRLERLRKHDWVARQITDLDRRLNRIKTLQETLLECLNDKSTSSADLRNQIKNLTNEFSLSLWSLEGISDNSPEEVREIESAYQLYKMLLKNRRFKDDDEQASSLSEMPEQ